MKTHVTTAICNVCGCEGAATPKTAAMQWIKGSFISHEDPRVCADNLRRKNNDPNKKSQ